MRGTVSKYQVRLKKKQRKRLEAVVRRRTPEHWMVIRARVILLSGCGASIQSICVGLSLDRQVVRRWRKRFIAGGVEGLRDRPRPGRPAAIAPKVWEKVATLVVQPPSKFGLAVARWSVRDLSRYLQKRHKFHVSPSSVSRFLRTMALRPHRIRYFLNPTDPDFDAKAAAICRIYIAPPAKTVVLCVDEKPGVQAISRKHPTLPPKPGKDARVEFEYRRNGTRNIFAAFNIRTGKVLVQVTRDRKTPRVIAFLDQILDAYPRGPILIITDNINTRRGQAAKDWLASHRRVSFLFTPFHGSWLNQVEIWFSILSSKALKGRSFETVRQLANAIRAFVRLWNRDLAHPFKWTYAGKVLQA